MALITIGGKLIKAEEGSDIKIETFGSQGVVTFTIKLNNGTLNITERFDHKTEGEQESFLSVGCTGSQHTVNIDSC